MTDLLDAARPGIVPPLEPDFRPLVLVNHAFLRRVRSSGKDIPLVVGLKRGDGSISSFETIVSSDPADLEANCFYVERLVKMLLWQRGGCNVIIGGPRAIAEFIKTTYAPGGAREFDAEFMGGVYEKMFTVEMTSADAVPASQEQTVPLGRHLEGCRIGFDLGASDRKVAAVIDGEPVYSEEVVWDPRNQPDPKYHHDEIMAALKKAASHMPRVDSIGGSSAGVYINNRVMVASLFRAVPRDTFDTTVKDIFLDMRQEWGGVPFEVVNDGEVTALAGAMSLGDDAVLGIAMGSSEAAGFVTPEGNITGWLNELAFAPVDANPNAPVDEWSGDKGVGALYFSQQAVFRLAGRAGIELNDRMTLADRLKSVQEKLEAGDDGARKIWETIGTFLGYGIAHYADFYDLRHVLILGRVTSGIGGSIVIEKAREVLQLEFPLLYDSIALHLPESESDRRVGQAVAAASLPALK